MTARETVRCLKGESEYRQGGCVVCRKSLSTTREAVMYIIRIVKEAVMCIGRV